MPVLGGGGTMPVGRSSGHESGTVQAMKRRYRRLRDQHGRWWGFPTEGPDGHACGPIEFISADRTGTVVAKIPPILPPPTYLKMFTDSEGTMFLRVHYEGWKTDIRRAWTDFARAVREEYSRINTECDWSPTGTTGMRGDIRDKVGPDPSPIEPVLACEQGNRWAVFGEGECPKALTRFFVAVSKSGSVLGDRELMRFDDVEFEDEVTLASAEKPIPPTVRRTNIVADLAALDEEFEEKGQGAGVERIVPRKGAKTAPNAYQTHMKEAMARGLTMAEGAKEWRELKGRKTAQV